MSLSHQVSDHLMDSESVLSLDGDEAFTAVSSKLRSPDSSASPSLGAPIRKDSSSSYNHLLLQRNPSSAQDREPFVSRQLSIRSDKSYDAGLNQSDILPALRYGALQSHPYRELGSGVTEGAQKHTLAKSPSTATDRSVTSSKSVHSVTALGSHPFGSLRVHSGDYDQGKDSHALECLTSGDILIVTGMPKGSFLGYDTVGLNIGPNAHFEGIKEIPSGAHFVYGASSTIFSVRNGFWLISQSRATGARGEIFVKRWDKYSETLEEEISAAEIRIQRENVPTVLQNLLPYNHKAKSPEAEFSPAASSKAVEGVDPSMWHRLTFAIKGAMLTRITSNGWNHWHVSSSDDIQPMEDKLRDCSTATQMSAAASRTQQPIGREHVLKFLFPKSARTFSETVFGRARTEQAMDTSSHIAAIIEDRCTYEDPDEVIGELQFCYITGMYLGNVACMEQWAHVVRTVFKAFRLAMDMPVFFSRIIEAVHTQLIYDEEGVEGSIFDHDSSLQNELKHLLTVFKSRLNERLLALGTGMTPEQEQVGKTFEALESWLWKWDWDLRGNYVRSGKVQLEDGEYVDAELEEFEDEDERGEYAPVVVDLEEDGREKGLIRL